LRYVIEAVVDIFARGNQLREPFRFKIGESKDFIKGEKIRLQIASYPTQRRDVLKWGGEHVIPLGTENGNISFS
jgi:hypothetical protein